MRSAGRQIKLTHPDATCLHLENRTGLSWNFLVLGARATERGATMKRLKFQ